MLYDSTMLCGDLLVDIIVFPRISELHHHQDIARTSELHHHQAVIITRTSEVHPHQAVIIARTSELHHHQDIIFPRISSSAQLHHHLDFFITIRSGLFITISLNLQKATSTTCHCKNLKTLSDVLVNG